VSGHPTARLENLAAALSGALATWAARDDTKAQPGARQAAGTAMDVIDAMVAELYQVRQQLAGEIRVSDDAAAARVDKLLEEARERREGTL
jgi:hypothetical protein